jgi:hypothetical protein
MNADIVMNAGIVINADIVMNADIVINILGALRRGSIEMCCETTGRFVT